MLNESGALPGFNPLGLRARLAVAWRRRRSPLLRAGTIKPASSAARLQDQAHATLRDAVAYERHGNQDAAAAAMALALDLFAQAGDTPGGARASVMAAELALRTGRLDTAREAADSA
ncbi:MAG: hypothetical protein VR70_15845, partial [Rhodospirillaceae bacterium BRH_c57]